MSGWLGRIAGARWFQHVITGVILLAGVLVGLETDPGLVARHGPLLRFLNAAILTIFVLEVVIKVGAEGRHPWRYFGDPWNVFDFVIVVACLLPFGSGSIAVVRMMRLLRVLRLLRAVPKLQLLVNALLKSMPSMAYVSLLLGLLFYVYGVAAVFLFRANDPIHFGGLGTSLVSLFRVVTLEDWTDILYIQMMGCAGYGYSDHPELCTQSAATPVLAVFFFVSFVLLGTMIMLNLFIGVIMNGMDEAARELHQAGGGGPAEDGHAPVLHLQERLASLQDAVRELTEAVQPLAERDLHPPPQLPGPRSDVGDTDDTIR